MTHPARSVLITGCSDGGMGAALAQEFQRAGLHVYATARDISKMRTLANMGIETRVLDVQSEESIRDCVQTIPRLDILINNAGATYTMPIADLTLSEAKKFFDLNVWSYLAVTQAFLPLLLKSSRGMIVNHTSSGVGAAIPFQAVYNASKAAMSTFSDILRLELQPFDVTVVNLKTGGVQTSIIKNLQSKRPVLPAGSIYSPARDLVETALRIEWFEGKGIPAEQWASEVVADLVKETPAPVIWRGESAWLVRLGSVMPFGWFDNTFKKMTGLDKIETVIKTQRA